MRTVLFISHNATRSGAPLYLFHLIKWLIIKKGVNAYLLFVDGGEMESEYDFCKKVWIWNAFHKDSRLKSRIIGRFFPNYKRKLYQENIISALQQLQPDLIVANTVVSLPVLHFIKQNLKVRSAAIIHEMKFSAEFFYRESLSSPSVHSADQVIAVNEQIRNYLCSDYNLLPENITVIPPFVNSLKQQSLRHPFEEGIITVGMSGYTGWQKGYDLLPQLLSILKAKGLTPYFNFLWIGSVDSQEYSKIELQFQNIGLNGYVKHTGKVDNMSFWFSKMDLFLSLSREDSYPLVCIEAAASGLPVIAFDKSGGMEDFLSEGGGILIPYLNIEKVVEALDEYRDRKKRMIDGVFAAKRAQDYSIDIIGERVCSFLNL